MISWADAYRRTVAESKDFRLLFGRTYRIDEFRFYAYPLIFETLKPALLAASVIEPNTGDNTITTNNIAAPFTNLVPGEAVESLIIFPAGAIVLGVTAAGILPQRIVLSNLSPSEVDFASGPSRNSGRRDLFVLDLEYTDRSDIVGQNPIPESAVPGVGVQSPTETAPPILADALLGSGQQDIMPARELLVTPGLGLIARVRSMVLPNDPGTSTRTPNLSVHVCFHCMVPGTVKQKPAGN